MLLLYLSISNVTLHTKWIARLSVGKWGDPGRETLVEVQGPVLFDVIGTTGGGEFIGVGGFEL